MAVYSGDDEPFDSLYKFVSTGQFNTLRREANVGLLDEGTLYVATFHDEGTGEWLPFVFGHGGLLPENSFPSQAEVLINTQRTAEWVDVANPRVNNRHGHIIELMADGSDPTSLTFTWAVFILCGDPKNPDDGTFFAGFDPGLVSSISPPDNVTFDNAGKLWIATDGQPSTFEKNDGVYAVSIEGWQRGYVGQFLSGVPGGEMASLIFAPHTQVLFCSVQHPGEGSVIAVVKEGGGVIGT